MITLKYPVSFETTFDFKKFQKQYNCVLRFAFNRLQEEIDLKRIIALCKELNNIELLDASWIEFACIKANWLHKSQKTHGKKVIFGGKLNFLKRKYKKISEEEFNEKRNLPVLAIGRSIDRGNRKFKVNFIEKNEIQIIINHKNRINLKLPEIKTQHHINLLTAIENQTKSCEESISIGFDGKFVYLTFDEKVIQVKEEPKQIKNRILSIDQNPNYTGIVVSDFDESNHTQTIIHKEVISIKNLNDLTKSFYKTNKRQFELHQITKRIVSISKHYKVETIGLEQLEIGAKDHCKGKRFNSSVNTWNRIDFKNSLQKWCNILKIKLLEIVPEYSSFVGCINNPNDFDMIAAAIEMGRRAYLFNRIFIRKDLEKQNIVFPVINLQHLTTHWKKMLDQIEGVVNWKKLYLVSKNLNLSYRFLVGDNQFLRMQSGKSKVGTLVPKNSFPCCV